MPDEQHWCVRPEQCSTCTPDIPRIGAVPRTPEEKRARIRSGQTKPQQIAGGILVALLFTSALGALVRLNVWLWLGR